MRVASLESALREEIAWKELERQEKGKVKARPARLEAALREAERELTILHGCMVSDLPLTGVEDSHSWQVDVSDCTDKIRKALKEG